MCTETCPCYNSAQYSYNSEGVPTVLGGAYYEYTLLSLQAYNYHERIFDQNVKDYYNITEDWPFFVWSIDRNNSYTNFAECVSDWEEKAALNSTIDLKEIFKFEVPDERDNKKRESYSEYANDLMHIEQYAHIEDLFQCSGMCKPALFYYGLNISEGYPDKTCLAELHEYLADGAESYAAAATGTGCFCLYMFFLHFGLYCRSKDMSGLANEVPTNQVQDPVELEMQAQDTQSNDVEEPHVAQPPPQSDKGVDF